MKKICKRIMAEYTSCMTLYTKRRIFIFLIAIPLLSAGCAQPQGTAPYTEKIMVGAAAVFIERADTDAERTQGLSGRDPLRDDQGVLFDFRPTVYTGPSEPQFWMKDMKFSLDLIWIKDSVITGITKNVPAPTAGTVDAGLLLYSPPGPVSMVLEVRGGWSDDHGLNIGDTVR